MAVCDMAGCDMDMCDMAVLDLDEGSFLTFVFSTVAIFGYL